MDELSLVAMKAVAIYVQGCRRGQEQCSANIGLEELSTFGKTVLEKLISGFERL